MERLAERARYNLARTTPVRLRDLSAPSAVLSREQWAIACAIDGTRSVQDLAWQCGLALYDVIECVGRLIQAGVCAPCARPGPAEPAGPLTQWFGTVAGEPVPSPVLSPTAVLSPAQVIAGLPQRAPMAGNPQIRPVMSAEFWATDTEPPGGGDFAPAQPELLHRVLDGLRRLG